MSKFVYNDSYNTCSETFASLVLNSYIIKPDQITNMLKVNPSYSHMIGDKISNHRSELRKHHHWSLSSESEVSSRDLRRHIDWVIDKVWGYKNELLSLLTNECEGKITCFWLSANGHGGPTLSSYQTQRLSVLNLDCEFDVYFKSEK